MPTTVFDGLIFANDKDDDASPDYAGDIVVGGVTYWLEAWAPTNSTHLSVKIVEEQPEPEEPDEQEILLHLADPLVDV
jgi:hypothetical protein